MMAKIELTFMQQTLCSARLVLASYRAVNGNAKVHIIT